jgi:protein-S-isoprenylcysteine O-methyltransferase Ste14
MRSMPALALVFLVLYGLLAFGLRMAVQLRRTGSSGFNGVRGLSGFVAVTCASLLVLAAVLWLVGPVLQMAGALHPFGGLGGELADVIGVTLATVGIALTVLAQFAMGNQWRIGVDPLERTELVAHGPFALVRNPIYAAMIPAFAGIALLAANIATFAAAILVLVALELHTRLIEEPYLLDVHGEQYASYAARVGRFLPGIGRLHTGTADGLR